MDAEAPLGSFTFLFTDVEGSTRLWELQHDAMRRAFRRHDEIVRFAIARNGGTFPKDQGEGDSVVAVFADPVAAVTSAYELQRALALEPWPKDVSIRVRVGLHIGPAEIIDGNYHGVDVNKAARLRSIAHGGQTLISKRLAEAVGGRLPAGASLTDLGFHRLKDLTDAERIFQLGHPDLQDKFPPLRSLGERGAIALMGARPPKLIGRDTEIGQLLRALGDAFAGRGKLFLLVGEPGIGKTRLAEEMAEEARNRDAVVLWGSCYEGEGAPAFWPWIQVIRSYLEAKEPAVVLEELGDGAPDVAQIVPELRTRFPEVPPPPPLEPDAARFRLFDSTTVFLRRAAASQPMLLVLDDIHWADEASLLLLEFLARSVWDVPVLVLATARDVAPSHPLNRTLGELGRQPNAARALLGGFTETDVSRYIETNAGFLAPSGLIEEIHQASEGNPFFVGEIMRLLAAEGRLDSRSRAQWRITLPPGARALIARRIGHLSEECSDVLRVASVVGRDFSYTVLKRISEIPDTRLMDLLDEAQSAHIISGSIDNAIGYSFSHALTREVLYEELLASKRAQLHLKVASALEQLPGLENRLDELAHHFFQAGPLGEPAKTIDYSRRSAQRSLSMLAYEQAVRFSGMALEVFGLQETQRPALYCDLLLESGRALWHAGDVRAAKDAFKRAAEIAQALPDGRRLAAAALGYGNLWIEVGVVDGFLIDLLTAALESLGDDERAEKARVMARLAMELSFADRAEQRERLSRDAVAMATLLDDPETLAYTLIARRHALWGPRDSDERLAAVTESIRISETASNQEMALRGRLLRLIDLLEQGDVGTAAQEIEEFIRRAEELRQPLYRHMGILLRSNQALFTGKLNRAQSLAEELMSRGQELGRQSTIQAAWGQLFALFLEQGRLEEIEPAATAMAEQYPSVPGWRAGLALIYAELGRMNEAREQFEHLAANGFADLPEDANWLANLGVLSEVCWLLDDQPRAGTLLELLAPYEDRQILVGITTPVVCLGSAARNLGMLATTASDWSAAETYLEKALQRNEEFGSVLWAAWTRFHFATMLVRRDAPGDRKRAVALIGEASAAAKEHSLKRLSDRIERLKEAMARMATSP